MSFIRTSPTASSPTWITDVITSCRLFSGIGPEQVATLAGMSVQVDYSANEMVFSQGDACPGIFVVHDGLVRLFRSGVNGDQHVLHLCGPGQSFAEVAVFAGFELPASATAVQPTQCVLIPTDRLQRQLAQDHALCRQLLAGMAFWTRHFVQLLDDIVLRDAVQRVARVLCDAPVDAAGRLMLAGTKKDVANHLNLASETFSRVLRRLSEDGIITLDSAHAIQILDPDRLTRLAHLGTNKNL